jgi:hypothetical protein
MNPSGEAAGLVHQEFDEFYQQLNQREKRNPESEWFDGSPLKLCPAFAKLTLFMG